MTEGLELPESSMKGHLKRRNWLWIWSKRFAVLADSKLLIYKTMEQDKIDVEVDIDQDTIVEATDRDALYRFTVVTSKETLYLETETQESLLRWVMAIRGCTYPKVGISMDDFDIVSVIGRGFYGKVMLVRRKEDGELLAIKSIQKTKLLQRKKITTVLIERNILQKVKDPFIVRLICAFQSAGKFYLGMEYVPGGELFFHMSKRGRFSLSEVKLYIAEIALALGHLHSCGIIYRDLKPENILLDAEGHIKLTDFGLAKDISCTGSTTTFCGTTEYFAPELVLHHPYGCEVDWWSLGVLAYELLFGTTPFHNQNRARLFKNILEETPTFPPSTPPEVKDMILKLLTKDPKDRPKLADLMKLDFFADLNFDDVLAKKIKPQYVPEICQKGDTSNFDKDFTQEPPQDSYVMPVFGSPERYHGFSFETGERIAEHSEGSFRSPEPIEIIDDRK